MRKVSSSSSSRTTTTTTPPWTLFLATTKQKLIIATLLLFCIFQNVNAFNNFFPPNPLEQLLVGVQNQNKDASDAAATSSTTTTENKKTNKRFSSTTKSSSSSSSSSSFLLRPPFFPLPQQSTRQQEQQQQQQNFIGKTGSNRIFPPLPLPLPRIPPPPSPSEFFIPPWLSSSLQSRTRAEDDEDKNEENDEQQEAGIVFFRNNNNNKNNNDINDRMPLPPPNPNNNNKNSNAAWNSITSAAREFATKNFTPKECQRAAYPNGGDEPPEKAARIQINSLPPDSIKIDLTDIPIIGKSLSGTFVKVQQKKRQQKQQQVVTSSSNGGSRNTSSSPTTSTTTAAPPSIVIVSPKDKLGAIEEASESGHLQFGLDGFSLSTIVDVQLLEQNDDKPGKIPIEIQSPLIPNLSFLGRQGQGRRRPRSSSSWNQVRNLGDGSVYYFNQDTGKVQKEEPVQLHLDDDEDGQQ